MVAFYWIWGAGRTTSPKSARPGCRFWTTPPNPRKTGNRNGKRSAIRKKNAYFTFKFLIINHINQYFNTYLHLIRFITYNRRIFIAKYLLVNKTCSIFAYVKNNINKQGVPDTNTNPKGMGKTL
jgi:hypothetical protein